MLFGKPKENLVTATCSVCRNERETIYLDSLQLYVCKRCIERGILYAADEAVKHSFDNDANRLRYSPPPPPPSRPLRSEGR